MGSSKQILGLIAAALVRTTAYNWLVRQGTDRFLAHVLAALAGGVAVRAIAAA
ncbi:hypothetical protein ACFOY4_01795 [Actinomadura syzygii]|uniref:hypothetical protein n=1 Tax=Actinomadura syzygii TaxID=1427538 RepID=UPI00165257AC|nr:hypothetical protein [Actinomadura syzygii]